MITASVSIGGFLYLFESGSLEILTGSGVFAIDPSILQGLENLGFDHTLLLQGDVAFRLIGTTLFMGTAVVIFLRRSNDWMTGLASFVLLGLGCMWFAPVAAIPSDSALASIVELVGNAKPFDVDRQPVTGLALILFLYLFPDGRFVPRWTGFAFLAVALQYVVWNLFPETALDMTTWSDTAQAITVSMVLGSGLLAQVYRYFSVSRPEQRQQTKLVVAAIVTTSVTPLLLFLLNPGLGAGFENLTIVTPRTEALYNLFLLIILALAMLLLPISIGVSVLRYRLWDVDLLINRTLVYAGLTGVLGVAYFAILAVVSAVANQSFITAAAATLGVAVLFNPARRRLQAAIDMRFYRQRYNAARRLSEFSSRLRQEIDLETLTTELLRVVEETMRPAGVSLWVSGPTRPNCEIMHRIGFWVAGGPAGIQGPDFEEVVLESESLDRLKEAETAVNLDELPESHESLLSLRRVGVKLAMPLVNQGELIGMLNLGPRLSETDYSSDDIKLLRDLSDHAASAVRVALLVREHEADMRDRERHENEMRVARLIQEHFFPRNLPSIAGWEVYAHSQAARDVGGDFYDFIDLPDGKLAIVAGDVTGKGVPAALVMASTRSLLRSVAPRLLSPAAILEHANEQLVAEIPAQMFVTCVCVVLDPQSGQIVFANAGHNLPYLRNSEGVREMRATGLPLGLMTEISYDESVASLLPGETIVLHSDGLAEARNAQKEMFGFQRLKSSLEPCSEPDRVISWLLGELAAFTGDDWEQDDDITLAVIHRAAAKEKEGSKDEARRRYAMAG